MDNPGNSLFQNTEINLNKSRNEEEEEDLEDQKRRNEELQNLVRTKLDDFSYDESTVNSSIVSTISYDETQKKYLNANNHQEQLQLLYDIRLRELQALKGEHKETVENMTINMDAMKKKLILAEAELNQLKISYKNSECLLVEKTGALKELTSVLESKENQIEEYKKLIDNMNLEISTYRSTINDLHLKLQGDRNPFSNANKQFNSEEYKMAVQEKVGKLEALLEEETKTVKLLEKENITLKDELTKLISSKNNDANLMKALTKNFESAQQQCEELIDVVETLSNENKHLEERLTNIYNTSVNEKLSLDNNNLTPNKDKLKKLLVDKSFQINSLHAKLRNYEENMKELLEYRKLKSDSYQKEFKQCDNEDHTKNLILMQNDLRNYKRMIEDKNQQILNLNSTNKDLLAKMEETLSQTRNDIKNFSSKYSLPQLEKMAEDLKASEYKIAYLEEKLKQAEDNKESELKNELETLKQTVDKERTNLKNEINKLKQELEISSAELKNLKLYADELVNENVQLKSSVKSEDHYLQSVEALQNAQEQLRLLQETVDELTNLKTIAEGERCTFEFENKSYKQQLENCRNYVERLETKLEDVVMKLKAKDDSIKHLQETVKELKEEIDVGRKMKIQLEHMSEEIKTKEQIIERLNEVVESLEEKLKNSREDKIEENLGDEVDTVDNENAVKTDFAAELKAIEEEELENHKEADILSIEIKLREEIQEEYFKRLKDVEEKYQKLYRSSKDVRKEQEEKLRIQENKFREHLAMVLRECTQKIKEYEEGNQDLIKQLRQFQGQNNEFKQLIQQKDASYTTLIKEIQSNSQRDSERWKLWSQKVLSNCLKIEATNKKSRDNILSKMKDYDSEVAAVEKSYEKITKMITARK
ncbi:putative leucine-rich repeat-containing protein DDB_G0290503 [Diorhabda sublineata]|uniref:putative leucine-rich repeat-containing protein DDB_G0290503 n=1 Tax=Diorhabda sublineata TaxID=1163346 RepID=UPI0024E09D23|nr:putative leucine-rich repeat-containing protein DDB_G0290503 [Diorhabda sublineata]